MAKTKTQIICGSFLLCMEGGFFTPQETKERRIIMKIKVGVIFGGETVEHEVSIISALQAINNIDKEKYEVVPIYILWELKFHPKI